MDRKVTKMIELMNMELLEVNARRRIEVIEDEMRAARHVPSAAIDPAAALEVPNGYAFERHFGRFAGLREPLTQI